MNAGEYLALLEKLPLRSWRWLTRGEPFVVLSPHPDDESLGMGGLITISRRHQQKVAVVLLTDGSQSHPNSKTYPTDRLVALRRAELARAAAILGLSPGDLSELGFADAAAPCKGPSFERAVETVASIVSRLRAASLFVTWEQDPHCDHVAAARLAVAVKRWHPSLKIWAYPVWGWHLAPSHVLPDVPPGGCRLDIQDVQSNKRAAIDAHVSQITALIDDDPQAFRFTPETLAPFLRPFEYYIEVN